MSFVEWLTDQTDQNNTIRSLVHNFARHTSVGEDAHKPYKSYDSQENNPIC